MALGRPKRGATRPRLCLRQDEDEQQLGYFPFFRAIHENLEHNEGERDAAAKMTAILGRMATYSDQEGSVCLMGLFDDC